MLIYVDDIIVISSSSKAVDGLLQQLQDDFVVMDLGALSYFLGIEARRAGNGIVLSQQRYVKDLLHKTNMSQAKSVVTPMKTTKKLSRHSGALLSEAEATRYTGTVGAL